MEIDKESISSTFYEQTLRPYLCAENLQSQTASTKFFWCKIIGAKAARKMLMKVTQGDTRDIFTGFKCISVKKSMLAKK